ncbi:NACHT domain-containing protein [Lentzea sp. PSKA42]|uniref:NACHT domain-containing protein n=1 Tax=Lentzea indica TaxID=2604800 RepID=A0ABX1FBZ9_9PSEU|nr:NACHT domain-containing protein [Lentzea indica]NKE56315.1 NACHT domain-containing protein [Lentzea indica]
MPTGLELVAIKAIEGSLKAALTQVGKRLWGKRISPTAKREKLAAAVVEQLVRHDFTGQLRLTVVLPELSSGVSLAQVKRSLSGPVFQGLLHELVAARIMGMPDHVADRVRENMQMATRLEFSHANSEKMMEFGGVLFDELDRVVQGLVSKLEIKGSGLTDLRQTASVTLSNSSADGIKRHNAFLKRSVGLAEAAATAEWEAAYRIQVRAAHGYIEPPDFERKRKVPLEALFVSPRIGTKDPLSLVEDVWSLQGAIDRSVLLGDPGGGKSTTSNVLAWSVAGNADDRVPFLVVLRNFIDDSQSIVEHVESRLSAHYQCPAPSDAVEGLLLAGRAIVIFDGLDELVDTSRRREVTNRVELFCSRYPLTRVLVTSRRVGYDEAAMDPEVFDVYQISEFSDRDVEKYVKNWFLHVDSSNSQDSISLAEAFLEESFAVRELRTNPLMLSLMCIIYRGQKWIPRNRPEMYEHCARLLFDKWDSSRKIYVELKASAYVDGAIKQLAYWMFTNPESGQGVTESALIREAVEFLQPAFSSRPEAEQAARQFIEFCRGRGWVLTDVGTTADGETLFAFMHRTFMEYFAAYELTRLFDGPEKIAKVILPRIAAAEWEIVAELAVQISNKHSRDGAARLLETLLNDKRYRSATSRQNVARFAMRCLGFVHVPMPLAARIARNFAQSLHRLCSDEVYVEPEYFAILPELRDVVSGEIVAVLSEAMSAEKEVDRQAAIELIMELPQVMADSVLTSAKDADYGYWATQRRLLFEKFSKDILSCGRVVVWFAAWRHEFITLEKLITEGPARELDPLSVLFRGARYPVQRRGWGDWGSFIPFRLLQFGMDSDPGFPVTIEELEWLGSFMDKLGPPPWVSSVEISKTALSDKFDEGDLLVEKFPTDQGWTLIRLMLIGIEGAERGVGNGVSLDLEKPTYQSALELLARKRAEDQPLPEWLTQAINSVQPDRRDFVWSWLNREIDLVKSSTC